MHTPRWWWLPIGFCPFRDVVLWRSTRSSSTTTSIYCNVWVFETYRVGRHDRTAITCDARRLTTRTPDVRNDGSAQVWSSYVVESSPNTCQYKVLLSLNRSFHVNFDWYHFRPLPHQSILTPKLDDRIGLHCQMVSQIHRTSLCIDQYCEVEVVRGLWISNGSNPNVGLPWPYVYMLAGFRPDQPHQLLAVLVTYWGRLRLEICSLVHSEL